jgi:hypothetical protein
MQKQQVPPLRFRFPSGTENSGRDDKFLIWNKKNLSKENSLEEMREFEQAVEGDQGERGTTPDHEGAFPSECASYFALAAPGDHEGWIVLSFHENDCGMRIEAVG